MTRTRPMLYEVVRPGPQFARSVNLERDTDAATLDGYLPTARALDTIDRVATALRDPTRTRSWSVTGPYGSGKSSLALLLDALVGPFADPARDTALRVVADVDADASERFRTAVESAAPASGLIRAVATAQRESAARTVVRALATGLRRYPAATRRCRALLADAERLLGAATLPARAVADLVAEVAQIAPVLLVIDEFGKNLEFFADRADDADLFVLQEIAERANGPGGLPVFFLTLQHLAFEEYATGTDAAQRREWAKVQGRFEDIAFADSSSELLQLVARVLHHTEPVDDAFARAIERWAAAEHRKLRHLGIGERLPTPDVLAAAYPLHPLTLAVLPEVCSRYGQRERTLFSFLARPEPHSVVDFLHETPVNVRTPPTVEVDRLFDYFMAGAATVLGSSDGASRWLEIDARIRETQGLSADEERLLKVVGILNLASRGGSLRASRPLLDYAFPLLDLDTHLGALEARGLLVYRAFADEYRIWEGSDFDLQGAVEAARRSLAGASVAAVCERALLLTPLVAARHSQDKGILRFFERRYAAADTTVSPPAAGDQADGVVAYVVDGTPPEAFSIDQDGTGKPVLLVYPTEGTDLLAAASDAAAIAEVLATSEALAHDWVARRELHERAALATHRFREVLDAAFSLDGDGIRVRRPDGSAVTIAGRRSWSAVLSDICDDVYSSAPTVKNEMIARRELSSQAARARRDLLLAMVERNGEPKLGIEGYGPERAMLEAVLVDSGVYREHADGWRFGPPSRTCDYTATWKAIDRCFSRSRHGRVGLDEIWQVLQAPPVALPEGLIPVLVTAALLARADDIAVYQDGTFQPVFGAELIERLVKTPERFAVKHFGPGGARAKVTVALSKRLELHAAPDTNQTLIRLLATLVRTVRGLEEYTLHTSSVSETTRGVRQAIVTATEPDELLFTALPLALGLRPFPHAAAISDAAASTFAARLADALDELRQAYPTLLDEVVGTLATGIGRPANADMTDVRTELGVRARAIAERVLEPRLRSFLLAAGDTALDDTDWVENLAMNVAERPPAAWRDDDRRRFDAHLAELLAAYRRVEMLHLQHLDAPGSAVARQVVVTTPEGHTTGGVVWLDDGVAREIEDIVRTAIDAAAGRVGAHAAEALLASLAERIVGEQSPHAATGVERGSGPTARGKRPGRRAHG